MQSLPRRGLVPFAGGTVLLLGVLAVSMSGCLSGNFDSSMRADGGADPGEAARAAFDTDVAPALMGSSCNSCHSPPGLPPAPIFGNTYDSITTYTTVAGGPLVDCASPETSPLVTKGVHAPGGAFRPADLPVVVAWIETFCNGGVAAGAAVTGPLVPQLDQANSIDLSSLAPGLEGAQITFRAQRTAGGLYLTEIRAVAGAGGLKITKPVFEACLAGAAQPDSSNAFADVDLTVPAGETLNVGQGTLSFVGWQLDDPIAIRFTAVEPEAGPGGPYTPGAGSCGAAL